MEFSPFIASVIQLNLISKALQLIITYLIKFETNNVLQTSLYPLYLIRFDLKFRFLQR